MTRLFAGLSSPRRTREPAAGRVGPTKPVASAASAQMSGMGAEATRADRSRRSPPSRPGPLPRGRPPEEGTGRGAVAFGPEVLGSAGAGLGGAAAAAFRAASAFAAFSAWMRASSSLLTTLPDGLTPLRSGTPGPTTVGRSSNRGLRPRGCAGLRGGRAPSGRGGRVRSSAPGPAADARPSDGPAGRPGAAGFGAGSGPGLSAGRPGGAASAGVLSEVPPPLGAVFFGLGSALGGTAFLGFSTSETAGLSPLTPAAFLGASSAFSAGGAAFFGAGSAFLAGFASVANTRSTSSSSTVETLLLTSRPAAFRRSKSSRLVRPFSFAMS